MKLYLFIHSSSSWALRTGLTVGFDLGHMVMYDDTQSINQRIDMLHCRAYTHNAAQVQLESWYWNKVLSYIVCGWCVAAMWQGSIRALGWDLIDMSTWRDPNPFCISHFCGKKTQKHLWSLCSMYQVRTRILWIFLGGQTYLYRSLHKGVRFSSFIHQGNRIYIRILDMLKN